MRVDPLVIWSPYFRVFAVAAAGCFVCIFCVVDALPGSAANFVIPVTLGQDDALAEQVEAGAAVHLALDHLKS